MKYYIIIIFSALVVLSNQKFDYNPRYQIISPNDRWKEIDDIRIERSQKDSIAFGFKDSSMDMFWNSYNISTNEDFQINFNLHEIDGFKILISPKPIENGSYFDSIGLGFECAKEDKKEELNLVVYKKIKGKEFTKLIKGFKMINKKIKIKIEKIQNKLLFFMNNEIISKDEKMEEFRQLTENQKIYIIIISSKSKDRSFINDLKFIKIFRPHTLVNDIKSKEAKRSLRKLVENQSIIITINEEKGSEVSYMNEGFFNRNKPIEVYLNNNKAKNYNNNNLITLEKTGDNIIEVVWENKLGNFSEMFKGCNSIVSINLSNIDTSNAKDMSCMFNTCFSLKLLDLSSFNTANIENMDSMFLGCSSLTSLDLSNFNITNVKNMYSLFRGCSSLESLNLPNFNIANVVDIQYMFSGCSFLKSLDLSNFKTINVKNMSNLFLGCSSLESLDLSNFNTSNVVQMNNMFTGCSSLKSLDLSNFNTPKAEDMSYLFLGCLSLKS